MNALKDKNAVSFELMSHAILLINLALVGSLFMAKGIVRRRNIELRLNKHY